MHMYVCLTLRANASSFFFHHYERTQETRHDGAFITKQREHSSGTHSLCVRRSNTWNSWTAGEIHIRLTTAHNADSAAYYLRLFMHNYSAKNVRISAGAYDPFGHNVPKFTSVASAEFGVTDRITTRQSEEFESARVYLYRVAHVFLFFCLSTFSRNSCPYQKWNDERMLPVFVFL